MSDKSSMFKQLIDKLGKGVQSINAEAKAKAEGRQNVEPQISSAEFEPVDDIPDTAPMTTDGASTKDDDYDLGQLYEAEPVAPKKSGLSAMTIKQKGLLLVVGIGSIFFVQSMLSTPAIPPAIPATSETTTEQPYNPEIINIDSMLGEGSHADQPPGSTANDSTLEFDPLSMDGPELGFDDQDKPGLGGFTPDSGETIDPFSGQLHDVSSPVEPGPDLAALAEAEASAPSENELQGDDLASLDNPFGLPEPNAPDLSGNENKNTDSGKGELLVQDSDDVPAVLNESLNEKDSRIDELQKELQKVKAELVAAKETASETGKPTTAPISKPVQPAFAATPKPQKRPTQRAAVAAKPPARPQMCVSAIAQAARNCTTCVPHAFVTQKGVESMVGQGDYVEGMRVSITGDRLDLQNATGEVVHKFWSSPNGCSG